MMGLRFVYFCFLLFILPIAAQELSPVNGIKESKPGFIAITNATIFTGSGKVIEKGSILLENDRILRIGKNVSIPKSALVLDYQNKVILPAFIEIHSDMGIPKAKSKESQTPQFESSKQGAYYWNEAIHPEVKAGSLYKVDEKALEEYLKMGFGLVAVHQNDGIAQGSSAVVSLGAKDMNKQLIQAQSVAFFSFNKGVSKQNYPSSQMGSIALLRQTLYDLKWYQSAKEKESNLSLDALNDQLKGGLIFQSAEKYEILRAEKIAREFGLNFHYIGSGEEYEILDEIKNIKGKLILPLSFPSPYDVSDPYITHKIPLSDLKRWETAPYNALILHENGIPVSFTSKGLGSVDFWKNIRQLSSLGLPAEAILSGLTSYPAAILGVEKDFGTLEEGKIASFVIYDKDPFKEEAQVVESWLLGEQHIRKFTQELDVRGKYNMVVNDEYLSLEISGTIEKPQAKIKQIKKVDLKEKPKKNQKSQKKPVETKEPIDSLVIKCLVRVSGNDLTLQFTNPSDQSGGATSLHAKFNEKFSILEGDGTLGNGKWIKWSAIRNETVVASKKADTLVKTSNKPYAVWFPDMAFGFDKKPKQEAILIQNVTLWTNEKEGIIEDGAILIEGGKISYVGKNNGAKKSSNLRIIDGKGGHVTSGIIDEHSHIAISKGVNEGSQAVTAEVSIGDVVRADDIDIYRQLSGGVTAAQLLHGSANPIGGQSALVKLKWGHTPEEMLISNAPKFIKFALGENVKQSNWGDFNTVRFPQTRMGVEQVMFDAFERAKKYDQDKKKSPDSFRTDLELEALSEILRKERFITCHSYIQSEINMLMHVADSFHFTLNTFTHILEGYKVADKMKKHGAGASTFSDWWAYKYEVNDAIPQNAGLLTQMGITTAINSDDAEMGRRLNQEAAKSVKYGGMSEEDALKMITLNPAKLLHLDQRMGSLKVGKDADLVLWSTHPLSIEAKAKVTIIDGEVLYDAQQDLLLQERDRVEKARIIASMLKAIEGGQKAVPYKKKRGGHFHCDTLGEESSFEENKH